MTPPGYLERFGFNPLSEFKRLQQLSPSERIQEFVQQRESYLNHVTEDAVVSIPYYYWLNNNGELFSSSSRREIFNIKNQVSFFERNGLFYPGIILAATMAKKNPNTLIALYSPKGKKLFDNASINNIQPEMLEFLKKPYDIGQLFFLYFDGVKINNVAVTINNNVNPWLQEMMPEFTNIEAIPDEEEKIVSYLNRPTNLGGVGNFFNRVWQSNHLVFSNVHGQKFFLDEVLRKMGEKLSGKWKISINPGDKTLQALQNYEINTELIIRGYLETVRQYMITHRQTTIPFGGGCGGTTSSL